MESTGIEESLRRAETAVEAGQGLSGTGFWRAVAQVKRHPEMVDRYADRMAAIDARAHREWALLVIPLWLGTAIAIVVDVGGLGLIWWSYALDGLSAAIVFLAGVGVLIGGTHALAHLIVGSLLGIRFRYWFVGEIRRPQPGVKVDYATYLRASARRRAWMHASGALTTKTIPFLLLGAAIAADLEGWVVWVLLALGAVLILADALWSTEASDWKKFRREMAFAQES